MVIADANLNIIRDVLSLLTSAWMLSVRIISVTQMDHIVSNGQISDDYINLLPAVLKVHYGPKWLVICDQHLACIQTMFCSATPTDFSF
jgi:hypothetical protein